MSEGTIICQNCWREQSFHGQDTCEYCNRSMVADATLLETLRNIQLESTPTHAQSGEQRLEFTPTSKLILKVKKVDKPLIYQFTSDRAIFLDGVTQNNSKPLILTSISMRRRCWA